MNILIPLAGKDERFESRGVYKPFVNVENKPLIKFCTDSLPYPFKERGIKLYFIILEEHEKKFNVKSTLHNLYPNSIIISLPTMTEGAACTVLTAKQYIDNEEELVIYLADIYFKAKLKENILKYKEADGFIPVFNSNNKKYSYAVVGEDGFVTKVAEKEVISNNASAGFYYFRKGSLFVKAAEEMIKDNQKRAGLGEKKWFFICPVYNELISMGCKVKTIPSKFFFDLGDDFFIQKYLPQS